MADDFDGLLRDMREVASLIPAKARQAVQQTAIRTKAEWRKLARGNPLGRQYTATIDYTVEHANADGVGTYSAEVGPDLARYGGKTGKGGLVPSAGIFDDPLSQGSIARAPDRARRKAEKFAESELDKGLQIAVDQSLDKAGL